MDQISTGPICGDNAETGLRSMADGPPAEFEQNVGDFPVGRIKGAATSALHALATASTKGLGNSLDIVACDTP